MQDNWMFITILDILFHFDRFRTIMKIFLHSVVQVAAYNIVAKKMAFFDPSRAQDFLFISEAKMRNFAKTGENPPDGFMCPNSGWCS
ncbi:ATP sulfurylase 2-like [Mercurialis annua]|uniref:ATP sulfurylase 2-like n=1 Tax=Mercurialis annua TaxID=3986 RepID=UPI00215E520C|nr:ATP sulfurylase 2-like [Mercurialis annua]